MSVPFVDRTARLPCCVAYLIEIENVRTDQGLPAREQNDRRSKPCEVVNQALALIKREFSAVAAVFRLGVAMNTSKVATAGYVPNYDGLLVSRKLQQV